MAVFNVVRGRARLSQAEFGVACTMGQDPEDPLLLEAPAQACLEDLRRAQLVDEAGLGSYIKELISIVLAPKLRVIVEVTVGRVTEVHSIWSDESLAVFGAASGDDEIELIPLEPMMLPWALALNLNLGNRPRSKIDARVDLHSSTLDRALELIEGGHRDDGLAPLRDQGGLTTVDAESVAQLLENRHMSWRASSVWTDVDEQEQTRTFTVVDGGVAGLWFSSSPAQDPTEAQEDPRVTLTPTTPGEVWFRLVDLFPPFPEPFQEITKEGVSRG